MLEKSTPHSVIDKRNNVSKSEHPVLKRLEMPKKFGPQTLQSCLRAQQSLICQICSIKNACSLAILSLKRNTREPNKFCSNRVQE